MSDETTQAQNQPPDTQPQNPIVQEPASDALALHEVAPSRALNVFSSPDAFIAGANVREFATTRPEEVRTAVERVQSLFEQLANLPYPTVAAINGGMFQTDGLTSIGLMRTREHQNNPRRNSRLKAVHYALRHPELLAISGQETRELEPLQQRNDQDLIVLVSEPAAALGGQHAGDFEGDVVDADRLSHRVLPAGEQLRRHIRADHRDRRRRRRGHPCTRCRWPGSSPPPAGFRPRPF